MKAVLPKAEIYRRMERFWKDPDKTLTITMFAEFSGLSHTLLNRVFYVKDLPMSEHTQIAVSRALERMSRGDVVEVYNRDRSKKLVYRQEPRPRIGRSASLTYDGDKIGLKVGLKNKSDYSDPTFTEQMTKGGRNGSSA
jgi:hypothetical protein